MKHFHFSAAYRTNRRAVSPQQLSFLFRLYRQWNFANDAGSTSRMLDHWRGFVMKTKAKAAVRSSNAQDVTREKRRVWKNVIVISIAFFFNFGSFGGLVRLQSSLNRVEGMGVITLSILYATLVISCLFVPKLMIRFIGHRWTIVASFVGYILYMAANGYAVWSTMIAASVLVGLCAAPLWTAQCSYFIIIAQHYHRLTAQTTHHVVSRFFGLFFMFFQACEFQHTCCIIKPSGSLSQLGRVTVAYTITPSFLTVRPTVVSDVA